MSSRGQLVIPEDIRNRLQLQEGAQFVVVGRGDTVVLKVISEPSLAQFDDLLSEARALAKKAKLKPEDVETAIKKARRKK